MRFSVSNGNGALCDKCNKKLYPNEIIKLYARKLDDNKDMSNTGVLKSIGKLDLCEDCYNELQNIFISFKSPRRHK